MHRDKWTMVCLCQMSNRNNCCCNFDSWINNSFFYSYCFRFLVYLKDLILAMEKCVSYLAREVSNAALQLKIFSHKQITSNYSLIFFIESFQAISTYFLPKCTKNTIEMVHEKKNHFEAKMALNNFPIHFCKYEKGEFLLSMRRYHTVICVPF